MPLLTPAELLSSDTIAVLVDRFAEKGPLGTLSWRLVDSIGTRRVAEYDPQERTLFVSRTRAGASIEQQVEAILHEIQHWNQHSNVVWIVRRQRKDASLDAATQIFLGRYNDQSDKHGYNANWFERDARAFAAANHDEALDLTGVGRQAHDVSLMMAVADIEEFSDATGEMPSVSDVRKALKRRGISGQEQLQQAIDMLTMSGYSPVRRGR